jgi:Ras family protein A
MLVSIVFKNQATDCRCDGQSLQLVLFDTAGQEDYERLRLLAAEKAYVILIGFAVHTPDSFHNATHKVVNMILNIIDLHANGPQVSQGSS